MPQYTLPELRYDFSALEPHISAKIMELHHGKHHAAYVKNANTAVEQLEEARSKGDFTRMAALERSLAFNLSGHVLHSIFWQNMMPKGGGKPTGPLAQQMDRDFGSFDKFRAQMNETASTIMGSGWAALVWDPISERLMTNQVYDHQSNITQGSMPLMVMDAWEHAFYLQYQNVKGTFFEALWNVWNWKDISDRFDAARKHGLMLTNAWRG